MPRPTGLPKTGGRKAGTPNKENTGLLQVLEAKNFNALERLITILPTLSPNKQADICLKLLDFVYPKRKAMEVSLEVETTEYTPAEKYALHIARMSPEELEAEVKKRTPIIDCDPKMFDKLPY